MEEVARSRDPGSAWAERQGELLVHLLVRPLSLHLTPPLVAAGVPPIAVTAAGGVVTAALPLPALWTSPATAGLTVAALSFLFELLDCLDGNVARMTGRTSTFGALVDGLSDQLHRVAILVAVAILASREGTPCSAHASELTALAAVAYFFGRALRDRLHRLAPAGATFQTRPPPARVRPADHAFALLGGLEKLYAPALALAAILGHVSWLLVAIAGHEVVIALASTALVLRDARRLDATKGSAS